MDAETIVKKAKKQGFEVGKIRHGWIIKAKPGSQLPDAWISRNDGGRGQRNNVAAARRTGVIL